MRATGYFLGATFGAAIIFFLISYILLHPRTVDEKHVKKFITDSDKILLVNEIPLFTPFDVLSPDKRLGLDTKTKTTYFSNRNMDILT